MKEQPRQIEILADKSTNIIYEYDNGEIIAIRDVNPEVTIHK